MSHSLAAGAVLVGVVSCARLDPLDLGDGGAEPAGRSAVHFADSSSDTGTSPSVDPPAVPLCERPDAPPGTTRTQWESVVSGDDALQLTSIAVDPTTGSVFVARAAGELLKLERSGTVVWRRPFGMRVATDRLGNPHTAGTFSGTLQLGATTLTSAGGNDVYVARMDPDGSVSLALSLGGPGAESVSSLAVDPDGSILVSGEGLGTVKLDVAGKPLWQGSSFGQVAVDEAGNVLLTGALTGTMQFGSTTLESLGGDDVFIAKLDATGSTVFALRFGDAAPAQRGEAIAGLPGGGIVVSGVIDGNVDFGGGALNVPPGTCPAESWCKQAGFVVELDALGRHRWSRVHAPARSLAGIAADSQGNVLVSGASPGNAPPYRIPLFLRFDARGEEIPFVSSAGPGSPATGGGAGHGIAFDSCDDVVWALSMPASAGMDEQGVVMKLTLP